MNRFVRRAMFLPAFLALFACGKPKVDDTCTAGALKCVDGKNALFCNSGKFAAESCMGPKGCVESGAASVCDNSFSTEKDGCDSPGDVACTVDTKALLTCDAGHWKSRAICRGPRACQIHGDKLTCDNDVAEVKDPCDEQGDYACSMDHKAALRCKDGAFATESTCFGPRACTVAVKDNTGTVFCDDDLANIADPCHTDGDYACSVDKKAMLRCKGLKFASINACRGPNACEMKEHPEKKMIEFRCDDSVAQVGDDCDENGELACAMDGKNLLACSGGKFANSKACPKKPCKMLTETKGECG